MSFVGDDLGFNLFVAKDFFKGLKKDPKRALLGVDPLSTKMWNGILGRKDKPLVDQLGGPYGGHTISAFGKQDGGVYQRARDAGINTSGSEKMQDAAHVIAAMYGANGLMNIGGGMQGQGQQQGGMQGKMQMPQQQQPKNSALEDELKRQQEERDLRQQIAQQMLKSGYQTNTSFPVYA